MTRMWLYNLAMIIGVDAAALGIGNERARSGNFMLSFNLLRALAKIDLRNKYILYSFHPIDRKILAGLGSNFQNKLVRPKKMWMQLRLSLELLVNPVDVFLGLNQALPFFIKCPSAVFCLDLSFEKFPALFSNAKKLSWQTRNAIKKADRIIAISNSTKVDIVKLYKPAEDKVKVISLAWRC